MKQLRCAAGRKVPTKNIPSSENDYQQVQPGLRRSIEHFES